MKDRMIPIATTLKAEDYKAIQDLRDTYGGYSNAEIVRFIIKYFLEQVKKSKESSQ